MGRRTWAVATLSAILCALSALRPAAAAEEFKPFVFIHAGDPELGKPDVKSTAERFALLAQRADAIGAEFVAVAGDLTRNGTDEELKAFQDCLKLFKMPVKPVPGNHDEPRVFERLFGPRRYVFTHNNCDFICLDSNDFMARPDRDEAKGKELWKWLETALEDAQRQKRTHTFLIMHHTLAARPPMNELLGKYRIAAVLCGHEHTTRELPGKGYTVYISPGTARFRDDKGLGYRIFKVFQDRVEQEAVPLAKEVGRVSVRE